MDEQHELRGAPEAVPAVDPVVAELLRALDPAEGDPGYWFRFRSWVLESAAPELARRRRIADLTVGDVMESWARTLVPTALAAAAVAALVLLRAPAGPAPASVGIDELLVVGLEEAPVPPDEATAVAFASERF